MAKSEAKTLVHVGGFAAFDDGKLLGVGRTIAQVLSIVEEQFADAFSDEDTDEHQINLTLERTLIVKEE